MKKIISILLVFLMVIPSLCVWAENSALQNEIKVTYNGEEISFDAMPQIKEDRVMVPFRFVFEAFGADVEFEEEKSLIRAKKDDFEILFSVGDNKAFKKTDGKSEEIQMDRAPYIKEDRTLVPVRFLAEAVGLYVFWNGDEREVVIVDFDELKRAASEKSELLKIILNMNLVSTVSKFIESEVSHEISFSTQDFSKVMAGEQYLPDDISFSVSFLNYNTEEQNDGKREITSAVELDTKKLAKVVEDLDDGVLTEDDKFILNQILKTHIFNIKTIVDENLNIYIKSGEILNLISVFDGGILSQLLGENYLLLPLGDRLKQGGFLKGGSLWDGIVSYVKSAENITGSDILNIKSLLCICSDVLCNEKTEKSTKNRTTTYKIDVSTDDYVKAITDQKPEMKDVCDKLRYSLKGEITIYDRQIHSLDLTEEKNILGYLLPEREHVVVSGLQKMVLKKETELSKTDKITLPQNVTKILN